MSYDLFFTGSEITEEEFVGYFSGRKWYELNNQEAWYKNEDTGVYFNFEYSNEPPEEDDDAPQGVSFNLNFFRPHFFALEAEPEVRAFVEHFGCTVLDPQNDGDIEVHYSTAAFLEGWNRGNEFAYSALLSSQDDPRIIHTRPKTELRSIWEWNIKREHVQETLGENIFVPRIMFLEVDGKAHSAVAWPDAIPALIPTVDALLVGRDELAPRGWFRRRKDLFIVPFEDARPVLEAFESNDYALTTFPIPGPTVPAEVVDYVKNLKPNRAPIEGIPMDHILDREIVEQYQKNGG